MAVLKKKQMKKQTKSNLGKIVSAAMVTASLLLVMSCSAFENLTKTKSSTSSQNSGNQNGGSDTSADSTAPRNGADLFPAQIGDFKQTDKPRSVNTCFVAGPNCDSNWGSRYTKNGDPVNMSVWRYKTVADAATVFKDKIAAETDLKGTDAPDYDAEADLPRFKITKRVATQGGGEMIVLDSLPRYGKIQKVYWTKGSDVYSWNSMEDTKNLSLVSALAEAYIKS